MSETVHYKGILKKVERLTEETLEDQCKRLLDNKDLPSYHDTYAEFITDEHYQKIVVVNGEVYQVEKEMLDGDSDIFRASLIDNENIEFEVKYYNGGCGFDEAIEEALNRKLVSAPPTFFKISHDGYDMKLIAAHNKNECAGYYLLEVVQDCSCCESLDIEELPADHPIEMSCVGFPIYESVQEVFDKLEDKTLPCVIMGLCE